MQIHNNIKVDAARKIYQCWRRYRCRKEQLQPCNQFDPILLDPLPENTAGLFLHITYNHKVHGFFPDPLAEYILSTGNFENPINKQPFNDIELKRLDKLTSTDIPSILKNKQKLLVEKKERQENESIIAFITENIVDTIGEIELWLRFIRFLNKGDILHGLQTVHFPSIIEWAMELCTTINNVDEKNSTLKHVKALCLGKIKTIDGDHADTKQHLLLVTEFIEKFPQVTHLFLTYDTNSTSREQVDNDKAFRSLYQRVQADHVTPREFRITWLYTIYNSGENFTSSLNEYDSEDSFLDTSMEESVNDLDALLELSSDSLSSLIDDPLQPLPTEQVTNGNTAHVDSEEETSASNQSSEVDTSSDDSEFAENIQNFITDSEMFYLSNYIPTHQEDSSSSSRDSDNDFVTIRVDTNIEEESVDDMDLSTDQSDDKGYKKESEYDDYDDTDTDYDDESTTDFSTSENDDSDYIPTDDMSIESESVSDDMDSSDD